MNASRTETPNDQRSPVGARHASTTKRAGILPALTSRSCGVGAIRRAGYAGILPALASRSCGVDAGMPRPYPCSIPRCAARTHQFRQCRRRCGPEARVPRRFARGGAPVSPLPTKPRTSTWVERRRFRHPDRPANASVSRFSGAPPRKSISGLVWGGARLARGIRKSAPRGAAPRKSIPGQVLGRFRHARASVRCSEERDASQVDPGTDFGKPTPRPGPPYAARRGAAPRKSIPEQVLGRWCLAQGLRRLLGEARRLGSRSRDRFWDDGASPRASVGCPEGRSASEVEPGTDFGTLAPRPDLP